MRPEQYSELLRLPIQQFFDKLVVELIQEKLSEEQLLDMYGYIVEKNHPSLEGLERIMAEIYIIIRKNEKEYFGIKLQEVAKHLNLKFNYENRFVEYLGEACVIHKSHYPANNQAALIMDVLKTGERMCTITTCVVEYYPNMVFGKDETVIKNYSENTGIVPFLVDNGLIELTGISLKVGLCNLPVAKVLW